MSEASRSGARDVDGKVWHPAGTIGRTSYDEPRRFGQAGRAMSVSFHSRPFAGMTRIRF